MTVAPVRYPLDLAGTLRSLVRTAAGRAPALPGTLAGSGEDALVLAFEGLVDASRLAAGDTVVLPDFVCSSVPRAVERSGLRVRFAALDPARWGYAPGALESALDEGARAFLAVSYFGLPPGGDADASPADDLPTEPISTEPVSAEPGSTEPGSTEPVSGEPVSPDHLPQPGRESGAGNAHGDGAELSDPAQLPVSE